MIIITLIVGVLLLAGYVSVATSVTRATRTNRPRPYPEPTLSGPESPAVVNLLVNGWTVTSDAAAATLVDLTAQEYAVIEGGTTRPLRHGAGLKTYEQMVLDRLAAVQQPAAGAAPLGALMFRGSDEPGAWWQRFREAVIDEARAAGLSQPRYGRRERRLLRTAAAVTATLIGLLTMLLLQFTISAAIGVLVVVLVILLVLGERHNGERDTPAGIDAASRWLSVTDPSPAYATALGRTPEVSAALPFSQADRRTLWSSYGGHWHQVHISYPSNRFRYGMSALRLLWTALLMVGLGGGGGAITSQVFDLTPTGSPFNMGVTAFFDIVCVAGFVVALAGLRVAVRTLLDIASEVTVTGQVQWLEVWRRNPRPDDSEPGPPWLYYLAIDDGRSDQTIAWGLPSKLITGVAEGVTITIRARPWTRRIIEVFPEQ